MPSSDDTGEPKRPKTPGDLLGSPYTLRAWCRWCRHDARLDVAALADRFGPETPSQTLKRKHRCTRCGNRQAKIDAVIPWGHPLLEHSMRATQPKTPSND